MKSKKLIIFVIAIGLLAVFSGIVYFGTIEENPENTLRITYNEKEIFSDYTKLDYKEVTGTSVNGKGEEKQLEGKAVLLKDILEKEEITQYSKVVAVAEDAYQAEITKDEILEEEKVYLFLEDNTLRLIVFGDKNSKRNVSNVVQLIVEQEQETAVTFTDDLGRKVTVNSPQRVATLLGSFADMWYLAGGTVVAAPDDAWDDFELPMAEDAVNLGKTKSPNLEKLFAAEPDFIIASTNTKSDMEWKETLEKSDIPTAYFDVSNFEDYLRVLKICTDITGREDLYEENGLAVKAEIEAVLEKSKERVEKSGTPKVLFLRASASLIHAKGSKGNVLGEMLKSLGCENIADSDENLLENVSMEHILKADPDYIFLVQSGDDEAGTKEYIKRLLEDNKVWSELTAVQNGKVYQLEKRLYNLKPNAQWGKAYEKLEGILSDEE